MSGTDFFDAVKILIDFDDPDISLAVIIGQMRPVSTARGSQKTRLHGSADFFLQLRSVQ